MHGLFFEVNGLPTPRPISYGDILVIRRSQIPLGEKEHPFTGRVRPSPLQLQTIEKLVALRHDCGSSYEAALANKASLVVDANGGCVGQIGDAYVVLGPDDRWHTTQETSYATFEEALDVAVLSCDEEKDQDEEDGVG